MLPLLLALPLFAQAPAPAPPKAPAPAKAAPKAPLKPLGFFSQKFPYKWDVLLPLSAEVDGLKLNTIFFNRRQVKTWPLKGADFGARAQVEVTNNSKTRRIPGFAVAVFDGEGRLLGVASGGSKVGSVAPGETERFDLNFAYLKERLPKGESFVLSVELAE